MQISAGQHTFERRLLSICAGLFLLIALAFMPPTARAQDVGPCAQELCLAGNLEAQDGGPACMGAKQAYSGIRSFDALGAFDPVVSALERDDELHGCGDFANELLKQEITVKLGTLFSVP
jgi:hypothetical protein